MNITLTDLQLAGLTYGTAKRNEANPTAPPMSVEQFVADLLGVKADAFAAEKDAAERADMAANEQLMALGRAVMQQPEKLPEVAEAVTAILES
jgi:hypothetical protein